MKASMSYEPETPFDSIEGAHEYLRLLAEAVEETREDIAAELAALPIGSRRADAMRLVAYKLERLAEHSKSSRRILNDLRTLRRLLQSERTSQSPALPKRRAG
jgi:hypothetical protein